ncbi:hypothetical protein HUO13_00775 [Saccharopolyspora erythraea]|nr:hypothetical protein HUO13_00775 [Saccharopolyspora erythraea]
MADDDKPQGQEPTTTPGDGEQRRGQMRYQDPESTAPREPTLAEQRARIAAEKRREEKQAAELAEAERKTRTRRRVMIGGGATVGVVALVAAFYTAAQPEEYTQTCTAPNPQGQLVAVDDEMCTEGYAQSHGGHYNHSTGMFFMPFFIGGSPIGPPVQYRHSYTPSGTAAPTVGQPVSSPNFTKPEGATIKDSKGSTVSRGGFGINNKSGSGS